MGIRILLGTLLVMLVTCLLGHPSHPSAVAGIPEEGLLIISTADLRAKLEGGEEIALINVMPKIIHDAFHIHGSVNIPLGQLKTSPKMPKDKDKLLVFYCMGVL